MGRSVTPKFVIVLNTNIGNHTTAWRVKSNGANIPGYGKPTKENIRTYVAKWEESFAPGGCNHQASGGKVVKVSTAAILDQFNNHRVVVGLIF